ncbi:phosphopantetheine-binding protein [Phytoactinopolyspora halotolerans]|uniref:Carrier domain-containing protein n=1 Tax=Phytoactinopolyspora halotolerans TaxID=1981512 RepID=A0A6L9S5C6_9ACTN|nr:phosphopantetheine-binding protein [Phytoactinopolyspora halotolerans]NED99843.1 hypothetical protein [Phytoactinopolyspora halotolerans]
MIDGTQVVDVLGRHPDVLRAVVIQTEVRGAPAVLALVEVRGYVGAPQLREYAWRELGQDHAPDGVLVVDRIPDTNGASMGDGDLAAVREAVRDGAGGLLYSPPADPLEAIVAQVWARVMKLERVGVDDDFLDVGGDSGVAVRIVTELERRFDALIDIRDLVEQGTVRRLAALLRERGVRAG